MEGGRRLWAKHGEKADELVSRIGQVARQRLVEAVRTVRQAMSGNNGPVVIADVDLVLAAGW